MARRWYVLHVYTGHENKVKRVLELLQEEEGIAGIITSIKMPLEQIVEMRDRKKKITHKQFLPGYILLEMDLPADGWKTVCSKICRLNGVTGFVGAAKNVRPQPISHEEARGILQKSGDIGGGGHAAAKPKNNYVLGDFVRIIDGPFESFTGKVEEVNAEKSRLRVMVGVFGRVTPVEVNFLQVEKT